jgi:hypothetical protein
VIHSKRQYQVRTFDSLDEMCTKLFENSWCGCDGFRFGKLLLLNDAFSPDGAQEYAVFHDACKTDECEAPSKFMQIESLTVSWMDSAQELRDTLQKLHDAPGDPAHSVLMGAYFLRFDHPQECRYCA